MRRGVLGVLGAIVLASLACRANASGASADASSSSSSSSSPGCDLAAIGLGRARPMPPFRIPSGCLPPPATGSTPIRSDEAFRTAFQCTEPSGVDFTRFELHVRWKALSPAGVGTQVVDDGATLTVVSLFREPCPHEPPPMPMQVPVAYLLPTGAVRTIEEQSCKVASSCDW